MANLDGIEKLVNEQGSSVILKERIGLINDKYKALERKLLEAEARAETAKLERQKLELELYKLRDRVRELEDKITSSNSTSVEGVKEKILQLLATHPDIETEAVAGLLKIGPEVADFHLKELENQRLAYGAYAYAMSEPTTWFLLQEGRRYLIAHGLVE